MITGTGIVVGIGALIFGGFVGHYIGYRQGFVRGAKAMAHRLLGSGMMMMFGGGPEVYGESVTKTIEAPPAKVLDLVRPTETKETE